MTDEELVAELAAIQARLAALADAPAGATAPELGAIRARLRELAAENEQVGERLAVSLGLRQPPRLH
jgi:hypothetical protein